jgi:hypothetical protein
VCFHLFVLQQNSFTEVAKLFTEFFRELDVVPSDVIAGLMLLRNYQKNCRKLIVCQVRYFISLAIHFTVFNLFFPLLKGEC